VPSNSQSDLFKTYSVSLPIIGLFVKIYFEKKARKIVKGFYSAIEYDVVGVGLRRELTVAVGAGTCFS
jgi:hypothetical protein